jgi:hypothetical protein
MQRIQEHRLGARLPQGREVFFGWVEVDTALFHNACQARARHVILDELQDLIAVERPRRRLRCSCRPNQGTGRSDNKN